MAGEVVPLKLKVDDETKRKQRLLEWRNSLAREGAQGGALGRRSALS